MLWADGRLYDEPAGPEEDGRERNYGADIALLIDLLASGKL